MVEENILKNLEFYEMSKTRGFSQSAEVKETTWWKNK